ncbi:PIN domain-containing protein [Streptomyces sp. 8K308]|uniref:type II toxin-antitoxin system VapC family toxin n=1 Tax=Streptomyces sp. 8K308 TaxID=2530388 RepID=UPI00104CD325|nr:PIN domain-containing protein [Streptomyces sp. 8K308]TDC25700.1 PIN domain-containing protein [Streptomyces sp. 8K308]
MTALIVDAGPLYALLDRRDAWHTRSVRLLESHPSPLVVPTLLIAEVAHLAERRLGSRAELLLAQDLAEGSLVADPVHPDDWLRIAEITAQYVDLPLGMVDASVIACAERHGATEVATVDRKHFTVVRPRHTRSFTLLP